MSKGSEGEGQLLAKLGVMLGGQLVYRLRTRSVKDAVMPSGRFVAKSQSRVARLMCSRMMFKSVIWQGRSPFERCENVAWSKARLGAPGWAGENCRSFQRPATRF